MKRRTTTIVIGAGLAAAVALTVVIGAASFAVTAAPRPASATGGSPAAATQSPSPTASETPAERPVYAGTPDNGADSFFGSSGAGVGVGTPGTAALTLTPGPIEVATTACMAARGYTWSNSLGIRIANVELEAVAASASAGQALTDPQTRALENAAAAAVVGVPAEAYPAYRSALTGDFANDPSACSGQSLSATDPDGKLGSDWENFQAIQLACSADRGFPLTLAQKKTLFTTLLSDGEDAAAATIGWSVERYRDYEAMDYGNTGTGSDYHWEDGGCGAFATHATANDHNN